MDFLQIDRKTLGESHGSVVDVIGLYIAHALLGFIREFIPDAV